MRIIFLCHTVAKWGGLHENTTAAINGLIANGHAVYAVLSPGPISELARSAGAIVYECDWQAKDSADRIYRDIEARELSFDVALASPIKSRELGIELASSLNIPIAIQFHGHYPDQAAWWKSEVSKFSAVSGSISEMLTGYCQVPGWDVSQIPNGVDSGILNREPIDPALKLRNGTLRISVASRLEKDKGFQWSALIELLKNLTPASELDIEVRIMGDGENRETIAKLIRENTDGLSNVNVDFTGWLSPEEVEKELRQSYLAVGSGRSALKSLAVGTPVIGAGRSANIGFIHGVGYDLASWSSFGDNPSPSVPRSQHLDCVHSVMTDFDFYRSIQIDARRFIEGGRTQEQVNAMMEAFLLGV